MKYTVQGVTDATPISAFYLIEPLIGYPAPDLLQILDAYPVGTIVKREDGRLFEVVTARGVRARHKLRAVDNPTVVSRCELINAAALPGETRQLSLSLEGV